MNWLDKRQPLFLQKDLVLSRVYLDECYEGLIADCSEITSFKLIVKGNREDNIRNK